MDLSDGTVRDTAASSNQTNAEPGASTAGGGARGAGGPVPGGGDNGGPQSRLQAVILAARYYGMELDPAEYRNSDGEAAPSAASLSAWAQNSGMWSRAVRLRWRHLVRFHDSGPVVLLFTDGSAGLLLGANGEQKVVFIKDPMAPEGEPAVAVDELRLSQVWSGEALLVRANRGLTEADEPFSLRWLARLVLLERKSLRDICIASLTMSFLAIFPPFIIMTAVDRVLEHRSFNTLTMLSVLMVIFVVYETLLGFARRLIVVIIGVRIDTRLNLHVFNRLVRLSLDYFERHPAGETMYNISQIHRVREFLTGKLLTTFLDLMTLLVLLPFLFWLDSTLAWIVVACACVMTLIILSFLRPLRVLLWRVITAETNKNAVLGETVFGVRTVKSLALEPQRKALWDERVAEAGRWRVAFGTLANWPQTLVTPIERFMWIGVVMIGVYIALNDSSGYAIGGLFAFMMLSQRVAQPLIGLARLIEDFEEVGGAIGQAASVLNNPLEGDAASGGLRPKFAGAITFDDVTFTYAGTKTPALDRISFAIEAGTMLGIVGRSGSGKSTITRLLQGINREYTGFLKIDSAELREINLTHLRRSFGVVMQDNFLVRGSVRDNITANRPGLTLDDAVRAARLAGAEEFIERLPAGYDTWVEEGSANLSGGQKQRLAIARALVADPRIMI
ncbi:MAG: peptidase domain-containing ABC transporter, partial [Acetobacteraceae bacterium]